MKDIKAIDKNFTLNSITETDLEWISADDERVSLCGVYYAETERLYKRMPAEFAEKVNEELAILSACTAGGRVRFVTDSTYIAIKCIAPKFGVMPHLTVVGTLGCALYANGKYVGMYAPDPYSAVTAETQIEYDGIRYLNGEEKLIELYLPLYGGVKELYIGVKKGSSIKPAPAYARKEPIVFYGSSITQGGCASRPGNDYISHLSRWLNVDVLNLGFSGNAKGEKEMADYLASLNASVFVLDYDYNAPTKEHLESTHYALYETIRARHQNTPILIMSKPDFDTDMQGNTARREVIYNTFQKAKVNGDENIYFIDGQTLFQDEDRDACTVDGCHPNDLGFYRMAKTVYPVLKTLL